jgi:hypothetical protein
MEEADGEAASKAEEAHEAVARAATRYGKLRQQCVELQIARAADSARIMALDREVERLRASGGGATANGHDIQAERISRMEQSMQVRLRATCVVSAAFPRLHFINMLMPAYSRILTRVHACMHVCMHESIDTLCAHTHGRP